ncbi:MAG TPA: hypothetical protein VF559_04575 [Caulobacteraceae bacterium]|jgi:hypothetical protein
MDRSLTLTGVLVIGRDAPALRAADGLVLLEDVSRLDAAATRVAESRTASFSRPASHKGRRETRVSFTLDVPESDLQRGPYALRGRVDGLGGAGRQRLFSQERVPVEPRRLLPCYEVRLGDARPLAGPSS